MITKIFSMGTMPEDKLRSLIKKYNEVLNEAKGEQESSGVYKAFAQTVLALRIDAATLIKCISAVKIKGIDHSLMLLQGFLNEYIADEYALRLTDNPKSFITVMIRLTDQNLSEAQPSRWVELLMYDHPSYNHRVEHARYHSTHRPNQQSEGE